MFNQIHDNNSTTTVHLAGARKLGFVATALVSGTVALAACGGTSATQAIDSVPEAHHVSPLLSDPGPTHQPDYGLLAEIMGSQTASQVAVPPVEFGGLPAPVGDPNWGALAVAVPPVEFGGMSAPIGEPVALPATERQYQPNGGPR